MFAKTCAEHACSATGYSHRRAAGKVAQIRPNLAFAMAQQGSSVKTVMFYEVAQSGLAKAEAHLQAHRAWLIEFRDRGVLLMAGPFANPAEGAMGVFTSREAAEELVEGDPFVVNGVVSRCASLNGTKSWLSHASFRRCPRHDRADCPLPGRVFAIAISWWPSGLFSCKVLDRRPVPGATGTEATVSMD